MSRALPMVAHLSLVVALITAVALAGAAVLTGAVGLTAGPALAASPPSGPFPPLSRTPPSTLAGPQAERSRHRHAGPRGPGHPAAGRRSAAPRRLPMTGISIPAELILAAAMLTGGAGLTRSTRPRDRFAAAGRARVRR